jgi:hypothetical protein
MKIIITSLIIILCNNFLYSQIQLNSNNFLIAKEFSKDISLFNAKFYLFKNVLGESDDVTQFEVTPLAAASSGELTTLIYKCEKKQKEGLILGFYGSYWNKAGVVYQGFMFKNFEKAKAIEFLHTIESTIQANNKFLRDNGDNNNIYFKFEDIDILVWNSMGSFNIRLFWEGFDSTWEQDAYSKSKRRFEKKIK